MKNIRLFPTSVPNFSLPVPNPLIVSPRVDDHPLDVVYGLASHEPPCTRPSTRGASVHIEVARVGNSTAEFSMKLLIHPPVESVALARSWPRLATCRSSTRWLPSWRGNSRPMSPMLASSGSTHGCAQIVVAAARVWTRAGNVRTGAYRRGRDNSAPVRGHRRASLRSRPTAGGAADASTWHPVAGAQFRLSAMRHALVEISVTHGSGPPRDGGSGVVQTSARTDYAMVDPVPCGSQFSV